MKTRHILSFGFLFVLLLVLLCSCGNRIKAPRDLAVDDEGNLSWTAVEDARSYTVEIKPADGNSKTTSKSTRQTHTSISNLDPGDYEIRIRAVGGKKNKSLSAWSEVLLYQKTPDIGFVYELINNNTEYRIKRGGSATAQLLIEDTYRGKPITAIGENAFKGNRIITEVTLGANIRTVDKSAFYNCQKLEKIVLPESVTFIGTSAFQGCISLREINFPAGVSQIPDYCFTNCRGLESFELNDNLVSIGNFAFNNTALTAVVIPDSVKKIGEYAFCAISTLTSVSVGSGITGIPKGAFSENGALETVTFSEGSGIQSLGTEAFTNNNKLKSIRLPQGTTFIGQSCFYKCTMLEDITIPETVTQIAPYAFNLTAIYDKATDFIYADKWLVGCKLINLQDIKKDTLRDDTVGICDSAFLKAEKLTSVALPDSVRYIGESSFAYCPNFWKFESGTDLRVIRDAAFANDAVLSRILLKKGLESIGINAFYGCSQLNNNSLDGVSIIPDTVTKIGSHAFSGTLLEKDSDEYGIVYAGKWVIGYDKDKDPSSVVLRPDTIGVADYAFRSSKTLRTVQNLSNCRYIGEGAFCECEQLATVTLNINLRQIENYTFYKCTNLFQISFPRQLTSIGLSAFYNCESLNAIDLSTVRNLESIDRYAFYKCVNLKEVNLGDHVSSIGAYAFYNCASLTSLTIPKSVETINARTFAFCDRLDTLTLEEGVREIGEAAFLKCKSLTAINLPESVVSVGDKAFYLCESVQTISFGNQLSGIGNYAFHGLYQLSALSLPTSLQSIGNYAFSLCIKLNSVYIPGNVTEILSNAFYGCKNTTFYVASDANEAGWNSRWNSSNRPVIRGVVLADTKDYVDSITIGENTFSNIKKISDAIIGIKAPLRAGYTFAGWRSQDGTVYSAQDITALPAGTTLVAVWTEGEPPEEIPPVTPEEANEGTES